MQKTAGRLAHVVRSHGTVLSLRRRLGTAASQPDAGSVRDDVEPHDPAFMNFKDSRSAQLAAIGTDVHPYRDRDACAIVALRPVGLDMNPEGVVLRQPRPRCVRSLRDDVPSGFRNSTSGASRLTDTASSRSLKAAANRLTTPIESLATTRPYPSSASPRCGSDRSSGRPARAARSSPSGLNLGRSHSRATRSLLLRASRSAPAESAPSRARSGALRTALSRSAPPVVVAPGPDTGWTAHVQWTRWPQQAAGLV
jgi:hypothetical protein